MAEAAAQEAFSVEVLTYGDLAETPEFLARSGLQLAQIRSMRAHPYAKQADPARLVLLRGRERVAHIGMIPGRIRVGAAEHRLFWGSANWEFNGDPNNRAGAGLLLLIGMKRAGTFAGCGPSDFSRPILAAGRFGFLRLPRRALLLRGHAFLQRRIQSRRTVGALSFAFHPLLRVFETLRRAASGFRSRGFHLELVGRFDTRIDDLDAPMRGRYWFPRDHRELNWAISHPWLEDDFRHWPFYLYRGGELVGYALARTRLFEGLKLGSIHRCAVRPDVPHAAEALLTQILNAFDDERVDMADVCTSNPLLLTAARRLGMMPRRYMEIACKFGKDTAATLRQENASIADFNADMGEGDVIFA